MTTDDQAIERRINILKTEEITPISKVVCGPGVVTMVRNMSARLEDGYHDMIVLFGARNQSGPERHIEAAYVVENNEQEPPLTG